MKLLEVPHKFSLWLSGLSADLNGIPPDQRYKSVSEWGEYWEKHPKTGFHRIGEGLYRGCIGIVGVAFYALFIWLMINLIPFIESFFSWVFRHFSG